jgi:hypothetical protein
VVNANRFIFALSCFVLLAFQATCFAQEIPVNTSISRCLLEKKCAFDLRGAATSEPIMSFIVLKEVWASFTDIDKSDLRTILRDKIKLAKSRPELFCTISPSAPFYRRALNNIRETKSYSVILSRGLSPRGELYVDETATVNF